jgi:hypothetical protein
LGSSAAAARPLTTRARVTAAGAHGLIPPI